MGFEHWRLAMPHRLVFVPLLLLMSSPAFAQQPRLPPADTTVIEFKLSDGSTLTGRVVETTDSSCTVVTAANLTVVVSLRSLASWRPEARRAAYGGHFGRPDPNRSRLFLAPTARTLPRGEGYVGDYYLFFPVVGYGILDRFMLSGGMSIIPGLKFDEQLLYLAPKVGLVQTPKFNLAAGALYMRLHWTDLVDAWGGVAYGVATFGGEDAAVTAGLGWPFASGGASRDPWVLLGAEQRVSKGIKLLIEGWKFPGSNEVPVVGGVRFIGERIAVDFGLVRLLGGDMTGVAPWLDFAVNW
jgi:hypothetical protein